MSRGLYTDESMRGMIPTDGHNTKGSSYTEHFDAKPYALTLDQSMEAKSIRTRDGRQSIDEELDDSPSLTSSTRKFTVPLSAIEDSLFADLQNDEQPEKPVVRKSSKKLKSVEKSSSCKASQVGVVQIIPCIANTVAGIGYDVLHWQELPDELVGGDSFSKKFRFTFCRDDRPFYLGFLVSLILITILTLKFVRTK
ncbi:MAG: hypothetical protein H0U27_00900 [Nitrosopumilus sp.]|nr:hypothetical protein [Nitrosopumilus sp.]